MRKVPVKNYIKLVAIILSTIFLALILSNIYLRRQNAKTSPMYNFISQITEKDLDDFFIEKDSAIIYAADKKDLSIKKFENKLIDDIKKSSLKESFVYLDIDNYNLTDSFKSKYNWNIDFQKSPLIILIQNHKIYDIVYINVEDFNFDEVVKTLE